MATANPRKTEERTMDDVLMSLFKDVLAGTMPMDWARRELRAYVHGLPIEVQDEFRKAAVERGRRLSSIAGAFVEELAVIGAGQ